jgi:hypothetical protein
VLDGYLRRGAALPRVRIPTYEYLGFGLEEPLAYVYHPRAPVPSYMAEFFELASAGREAEIFAELPRLLRSVTDDRPFFFFNFFGELRPLVLFLVQIAALAAVFILLPLGGLRRDARVAAHPAPALLATLGYFFVLGAGYLVVEVVLMQRFVLFLGHPSYSISVTLFALLLWSSLGALAAGRAGGAGRRGQLRVIRGALAAIAILVLLFALDVHAPILAATRSTGLAARAGIVFLLVAPLGFLMGVPFPTGLGLLAGAQPRAVPWAIGVNGFASVIAAVGNIPLAMIWGFRTVLLLGGTLYLAAWVITLVRALPEATADR